METLTGHGETANADTKAMETLTGHSRFSLFNNKKKGYNSDNRNDDEYSNRERKPKMLVRKKFLMIHHHTQMNDFIILKVEVFVTSYYMNYLNQLHNPRSSNAGNLWICQPHAVLTSTTNEVLFNINQFHKDSIAEVGIV